MLRHREDFTYAGINGFNHKNTFLNFYVANAQKTDFKRILISFISDVVLVNGLFCLPEDLSIYNQLLDEIESSGIDSGRLWKMHHGNQEIEGTHVIADDKANWKRNCPTFSMVIDKMAQYFNMDVKATR